MPELFVRMFGSPAILVDGKAVGLPYRKAEALLYYLVLNRRVSRRELIDLLWEDTEPAAALKNLRHAAYTVRKVLGMELFLSGQRTVLELNPEISLRCDVLDFLEDGGLDSYHGEFLSGFTLQGDCPFEEWVGEQRNLLRARYLSRLLAAEREAFAAGDLERAERLGLEYIAQDPLEESAYVVLMENYGQQKKFRKAMEVYHRLCRSLESELSISPLKETTALYYRIVNEWNSSTRRAEEQSDHPIFGKEAALRSLLSVCSRPLSERSCPCILLEGEAGVGKTYLLDHVLSHYDFSDRLVLRAYCYQSESGVPLAPWDSIMLALMSEIETRGLSIPESCLRMAAGLFPCLSLKCGQSYAASDGNYPLQHNYHVAQESTLLILSMVARQIPLLLVFEDMHWIDRTSLGLLSAFLRRLRGLNVTVICSSREMGEGFLLDFVEKAQRDKILERYRICAFSREETMQFIRHYQGQELTGVQLERIYQGTGGNALLLSQLVTSLREAGDASDISQILKGVISYRLSQLTLEEVQVLDIISTFVEWAPMDALTAILTRDTMDLLCLCSQLKGRMLITEAIREGRICYALAHEQIRAVLSQRQSESARRILHLRVAQYLESQPEGVGISRFDRLVYHYEAGGNRLKAFQYRVLSLSSFTSLTFALLPTLPGVPEGAQPDTENLPARFLVLEKELRELRQLYPGPGELDRLESVLLHAKGRYCIYSGRYEPGLDALAQLTALCRRLGDTEMLAQAHLQYIYYAIQIYDTDLMRRHLDEGMALLAGQERTETYGIYLRLRGLLEQMRGSYPAARALLERSVETLSSLSTGEDDRYAINIAGAYNYIAECWRMEGHYEEAFAYYDKAIIHNRSRGYYPGAAVFYTNYGICAFQKGEYEAARQLFLYAVEIYSSSQEYSGYPMALAYLALFQARRGELADAAAKLRQAHCICDIIGSPWWKGVTIYLSWRIRTLLDEAGQDEPELRALWPEREEEHCAWGLSFLRRLPPCLEAEALERRLAQLEGAEGAPSARRDPAEKREIPGNIL